MKYAEEMADIFDSHQQNGKISIQGLELVLDYFEKIPDDLRRETFFNLAKELEKREITDAI